MTLVWYVAYGSNLAASRLNVYLRGGRPSGALRGYAGARDPSPPSDDRPVTLRLPLYFAGTSRTWGGGAAFVHPQPRPGARTLARAWLLRAEQLEDVVAQERGVPPAALDVEAAACNGTAVLGQGRYGTLVACEPIDGVTAVTCTAPPPGPDGPVTARPTLAYLRTIARGLAEAHGLGPAAAAAYLVEKPGVRGTWERHALAAALAGRSAVTVS